MNYKSARVSTSLDISKLGEALSRPGIDPRCWVSLATIEDIAIDPDEGIFADVFLMPSRQTLTARVMSPYIGDGYGLFFPLKVGDEVLVGWPSGDPMMGLCILGRLFSPTDKPSLQFSKNPATLNPAIAETLDTTDDIVLVVEPGQSVKITVSGPTSTNQLVFNGDEFRVNTTGTAKVYLGEDSESSPQVRTTQPLVLGNELENYMGNPASVLPGTGGLLGYIQRLAAFAGYLPAVEPVPLFPLAVKATKVEGK